MQSSIFLIWVGALLIVCGVLFMAAQAIWKGRMSEPRRSGTTGTGATLEPRGRVKAFSPRANWPGFAMIGLGIVLMLAEAVV